MILKFDDFSPFHSLFSAVFDTLWGFKASGGDKLHLRKLVQLQPIKSGVRNSPMK